MKLAVLVLAIITPLVFSASTSAATNTKTAYGVTVKAISSAAAWKMEVTADKPGHQVQAVLKCGVQGGGTAWGYGRKVRQARKTSTVYDCPGAAEVPVQDDWQVNLGTAKHPHWRLEKYANVNI